MYVRTVDLLKIRDGEPVDARVRASVDATPSLRAEVERLRETQAALRALPTIEPPPGARERVLEATESRSAPAWRWPLRGAIAAAALVAAVVLIARAPESPQAPPPSTTVAEASRERADAGLVLVTPAYASLVAESARLERQLSEIGDRPRLMNAGTAVTITGLEDQIAWIDAQLMYARAHGLGPSQAEALQQRRIDLMNALLQVRYAHAQRTGLWAHLDSGG